MAEALDIVFAGTPEFAATHLAGLIGSRHRVVAVYTQPDRPAGRGNKLRASPVKQLAQAHELALHQPATLKNEAEQQRLESLGPDLLVVVAYGLILPQAILDTPRYGCINVHASLLPRWRGAAPIQRAIEAGDTRSGTTIMQMDAGLDTGAMLAQATCPIGPDTTAATLHDELEKLGVPLLVDVLDALAEHRDAATPQPAAGVTYAEKISKSEAEIDWSRSAVTLDRQIRAFNPFPVCYTRLDGARLKLWLCRVLPDADSGHPPGTVLSADEEGIAVQCGSGRLQLTRLQMPGGKPLSAAQLLHSRRETFAPGRCLGAGQESAR